MAMNMKKKVDILPFVEELEGEVVDGDLPDAQHHLRRPLDQAHRRRHVGSQG